MKKMFFRTTNSCCRSWRSWLVSFSGVALRRSISRRRLFRCRTVSLVTMNFTLDAPIICPFGSPTCDVVLPLTVSDPARVLLSASSLTWADTDWAQTRSVTLTWLDDGVYNAGSDTVTLSTTAVSSSVVLQRFRCQPGDNCRRHQPQHQPPPQLQRLPRQHRPPQRNRRLVEPN